VTPGPNFFYILTRGATQGRRAAVIAACGLGAGVLIHTALAALGVAAVIRSSYLAFRVIKYAGSLYLVHLGVKALRGHLPAARGLRTIHETDARVFWQSIVASLTNPKTILFFLSFLPQFVSPQKGAVTEQMLVLGGIYMLITVLVYASIGYFADRIGRRIAGSAGALRLRWVTAASFFGLGLWSALPDRR
jgi:threonine/homoserine/homoserine lactone efflux protein